MRIDAITIFPAYFDALELSLLGKAREKSILEINVHDLRDYTHDKHKTVDDSPYGGGAGMLSTSCLLVAAMRESTNA